MNESLFINGEEYVAAARAAAVTGVSPAYVERLAAGRWIDAAVVHGVWFVNLDSLSEFLTNVEQDVYQHVTARERRMKAAAVIAQLKARQALAPNREWVVIGQTAVIVACGLLVSVLSVAAWQAELDWTDLQAGVMHTSLSVVEGVVARPMTEGAPTNAVQYYESAPQITNYYPPLLSSLLSFLAEVF